MRKSLGIVLSLTFAGISMAQVQAGRDTVQDAIRFERQKDAADARQARIESQRSTANRSSEESSKPGKKAKARKSRSGSAARSNEQPQQQPPR